MALLRCKGTCQTGFSFILLLLIMVFREEAQSIVAGFHAGLLVGGAIASWLVRSTP